MRIRYSLIPKLATLSNCEMDFVLYLARLQDESGLVSRVYYKDVCKGANMCKASFYNCLESLHKKGLITYMEREYDYDVILLGNDFTVKMEKDNGYIDLTKKVFHKKSFIKMNGKEKFLVLEFTKNVTSNTAKTHPIGIRIFYDKYSKLLNIGHRTLRGYLFSLRKFFEVTLENKIYCFKLLDDIKETARVKEGYLSKMHHYFCDRNLINAAIRMAKIKNCSDKEKESVYVFLKQYFKIAQEKGKDLVTLILASIFSSVRHKKEKLLDLKAIHAILRERLELA